MFQGVKEIKVAGVTFNNKDGSSRQELLRKFDAIDEVAVSLLEHTYKGEPAFHVLVDGEIIGNIPKDKAPFIAANRDGIGFDDIEIAIYKGKDGINFGATVYIPYEASSEWLDEPKEEEYINPSTQNTYQPQYGQPAYGQNTTKTTDKQPFYATNWFNILMLLFVTPVGIFTMWCFSTWSKRTKIIITVLCVLSFLANYIYMEQMMEQMLQMYPSMGTGTY